MQRNTSLDSESRHGSLYIRNYSSFWGLPKIVMSEPVKPCNMRDLLHVFTFHIHLLLSCSSRFHCRLSLEPHPSVLSPVGFENRCSNGDPCGSVSLKPPSR